MISTPHLSPAPLNGCTIGAGLSRLSRAFAHSAARRAARRALRDLDDHMLRDIGIPRSGIEAALNGVFVARD